MYYDYSAVKCSTSAGVSASTLLLKPATSATAIDSTTSPDAVETAPAAATQEAEVEGEEIVSPMVGTFYSSSDPDSPPFVSVGDEVSEDTTVCIMEAMKIFNEIKAQVSGKIVKVLVKSGDPVEFGQPLFIVKT